MAGYGSAVAAVGRIGSADANSNIVGTWTRRHDGKIVQEITFTPAGTFDAILAPMSGQGGTITLHATF